MHFNPRSREESDVHVLITQQLVSDFNPRSREGSDNRLEAVWMKTEIFQSTLPQGERRDMSRTSSSNLNFNPRSREGSDTFGERSNGSSSIISIRAPARGATIDEAQLLFNSRISIRAPTRGATRHGQRKFRSQKFQSALPRGERHRAWRRGSEPADFNPRSHEGSDTD